MFERCLYFNTNTLVRQVNKIWDEAFQEFGLSPAHAYLLRLVLSDSEMTQTQIASELNLEKSTVTRFIDSLEKRGYLTRNKIGREHVIAPTAAAKKIKAKLNKKGDALYQTLAGKIGKDNLKQLVGQLRNTSTKIN
jgi:DNA-binding MarR family transcriptional regulator